MLAYPCQIQPQRHWDAAYTSRVWAGWLACGSDGTTHLAVSASNSGMMPTSNITMCRCRWMGQQLRPRPSHHRRSCTSSEVENERPGSPALAGCCDRPLVRTKPERHAAWRVSSDAAQSGPNPITFSGAPAGSPDIVAGQVDVLPSPGGQASQKVIAGLRRRTRDIACGQITRTVAHTEWSSNSGRTHRATPRHDSCFRVSLAVSAGPIEAMKLVPASVRETLRVVRTNMEARGRLQRSCWCGSHRMGSCSDWLRPLRIRRAATPDTDAYRRSGPSVSLSGIRRPAPDTQRDPRCNAVRVPRSSIRSYGDNALEGHRTTRRRHLSGRRAV